MVDAGEEAAALAPIPISILEKIDHVQPQSTQSSQRSIGQKGSVVSVISVVKTWGIRTLGELAALPSADLAARLGRQGLVWQAIARGDDTRPLVPTRPEERFDATHDLEWPIDGLEPLSFVLTRLLEPLSTRLEARDRGAAALYIALRLVTREIHARRLDLPSPLRDVRTLRTLALLDLESHPPGAAIDQVTITIDPTPGRVLQHTLFTRPHPTPEQLSTLLARLGALMGQDRIGAPVTVDSYRPGAFTMKPFAIEHDHDQRRARRHRRDTLGQISASAAVNASEVPSPPPPLAINPCELRRGSPKRQRRDGGQFPAPRPQPPASNLPPSLADDQGERGSPERQWRVGGQPPIAALRRCRYPVPAHVAIGIEARPIRVTTDRRGFAGGAVTACAGPWRTSGEWWTPGSGLEARGRLRDQSSGMWDRDEWDVALGDGGIYRIFRDRSTDAWFIDAIVD